MRVSVLLDDLLCSAAVTSNMLHVSLGNQHQKQKKQQQQHQQQQQRGLRGQYAGLRGQNAVKANSDIRKFSSPSPSLSNNGSRGSSSNWLSTPPAPKSAGSDALEEVI